MIGYTQKRGFTLLELLITITVTMIVLAGTMAMFTKINQSVLDTNRNNDFTFQNRSLIDLLKQDFQKAGKGMNDFSVFNVNYDFNTSFAITTPGGKLYPVADIAYDDSTKTSEIILHYFDYDISGVGQNNPTFLAMLDNGDLSAFGDNMSYMNLISNDETGIDQLAEGDFILIYRFDALRQSKAYNDDNQSPWENLRIDGFRTNDAVLLEVVDIEDKESNGIDDTEVSFSRKVLFGDGQIFKNSIDMTSFETQFEDALGGPLSVGRDISQWLFESDGSNVPGLRQQGLFFARKLGKADAFRRVHYRVEDRSGNSVLLRTENGVEEVLAEYVEEFHIFLGVDVPKGMGPGAINNTEMDGYVTSADSDQWTRAYDDPTNAWSITSNQFDQIIGRHAVAAMVKLIQKVAYPDPRSGISAYKTRAFEHQFKLATSRPSQYQIANPNE